MPAASPTLRLLSWNLGRVHLGGRVNRWLGLDSRASDRSLGHVARVILRADAEVVAVQELSSEAQLERLRALLGRDWQAAAPARPDCDRRVGLLARRGLAPEFFPVASATGRTAQAATLRIGRERRFAVASLHLDAFDDAARARQAQELLSFAAASGEAAPVLAGDFNFDLTHPAAHRPRDRSTWRALAAALSDLGKGAGPTALLGRRLDYVLARRGVRGTVRVLRGLRVALGDHDPLLARLAADPGGPGAC